MKCVYRTGTRHYKAIIWASFTGTGYLGVVELGLHVERLHDLELEKLPEVELVPPGGRVVDLADEDVGAQLLHLVVEHEVDGAAGNEVVGRERH